MADGSAAGALIMSSLSFIYEQSSARCSNISAHLAGVKNPLAQGGGDFYVAARFWEMARNQPIA
jgi:hypothetical protein